MTTDELKILIIDMSKTDDDIFEALKIFTRDILAEDWMATPPTERRSAKIAKIHKLAKSYRPEIDVRNFYLEQLALAFDEAE